MGVKLGVPLRREPQMCVRPVHGTAPADSGWQRVASVRRQGLHLPAQMPTSLSENSGIAVTEPPRSTDGSHTAVMETPTLVLF